MQRSKLKKPALKKSAWWGGGAVAAWLAVNAIVAENFDYYVLSLSWSPQYCATSERADARQCHARHPHGMILHGLWPQQERGYPQSCPLRAEPKPAVVDAVLDVMPSAGLVKHEWRKHGACSGMGAAEYFAAAEQTFRAINLPAPLDQPRRDQNVRFIELKQAFLRVNPQLTRASLRIICDGNYLSEVRVCLDKNYAARACGADLRDRCRGDKLHIRPAR